MHPLERIRQKAANNRKRIVLPEATDERMLRATQAVCTDNLADIVLLGDGDGVRRAAKEIGCDISGAEIINHLDDNFLESYAAEYLERRTTKGISEDTARRMVSDPLFFGAYMVKHGRVDGMVAGAVNSSANVIRSVLHIIGTSSECRTLSSCFIMIVPDCEYGSAGAFIYADCGVFPDPNADQLADIAVASARSCRILLDVDPVVAMLSFSTKGSAKDPLLEKVVEATRILKEDRKVDFPVDGELQVDTAIVPSVAGRKAADSPVGGKANVLIFPDLNAGNIAYKITQRLAKAEAYGPLIQGSALPVNDLSRGCSTDDIIQTIAITSVEAA